MPETEATAESTRPAPSQLPRLSIAIAVLIVIANALMPDACTPAAGERWGLGPVIGSQWWRLFSAFAPHTNPLHLVLNALYLVSVGFFVEPMLGRLRTGLVLLGCHVAGGIAVLLLAPVDYFETGASNAIHGLLACAYAIGLLTFPSRPMRWMCVAGLVYFAFMTVYAIITGHMPWPIAFFANAGWGHLGGIVTGTIAGLALASQDTVRRAVTLTLTSPG